MHACFLSDLEEACLEIIADDTRIAIVRVLLFLQECNDRDVASAVILTDEVHNARARSTRSRDNEEYDNGDNSACSNYIAIELLTALKYSSQSEDDAGASKHTNNGNGNAKAIDNPEPVIRVSYATSTSFQNARSFLRDVSLENILLIQTSDQALYDIHDGALYKFVDGCGLWDAPSSLEVHEGIIAVSSKIMPLEGDTETDTETDAGTDTDADSYEDDGDGNHQYCSQSQSQSQSSQPQDGLPTHSSLYHSSSDESYNLDDANQYMSHSDEDEFGSDEELDPNELDADLGSVRSGIGSFMTCLRDCDERFGTGTTVTPSERAFETSSCASGLHRGTTRTTSTPTLRDETPTTTRRHWLKLMIWMCLIPIIVAECIVHILPYVNMFPDLQLQDDDSIKHVLSLLLVGRQTVIDTSMESFRQSHMFLTMSTDKIVKEWLEFAAEISD